MFLFRESSESLLGKIKKEMDCNFSLNSMSSFNKNE